MSDPAGSSRNPHAARPTIWFDAGDFLKYFRHARRPTGIQRVQMEVFSRVRDFHWGPGEIRFCQLNRSARGFEVVEFETLLEAFQHPPLPAASRFRRRATFYVGESMRRALGRAGRALRPNASAGRFNRGDILVCLGSAWENRSYTRSIERARRDFGVRFAVMVHDIIPVTHPQWVAGLSVSRFRRWLAGVLANADLVLTVSNYSRAALLAHAAKNGLTLPTVEVVNPGTGFPSFGPPTAVTGIPGKLPSRFALFVSTIETRKNHRLLVGVWRRLIERHGVARIPHLVFAGRRGWGAYGVMAELAADRYLGGKIVVLSGLSDAELDEAYRQCLFTVFPSLIEGWGLSVAESLLYGKLCVASNRGPIPEVGGDLVDYIDPEDEAASLTVIERVILDDAYRQSREARIRAEAYPRSWNDHVTALMASLDRLYAKPGVGRKGSIRTQRSMVDAAP